MKLSAAALLTFSLFAAAHAEAATTAVNSIQPTKGVIATAPRELSKTDLTVVAVTDFNVIRNPSVDFSLSRTLGQIISTAQVAAANTPENRTAFLATMIKSFAAPTALNTRSNLTVNLLSRPGEAAMDPAKLLTPSDIDGMRPVGLFNRLDLAPSNWANCGEYRIIYAKGAPVAIDDRFLLIFEAALDNPHPEQGAIGCLPVAKFWLSLRNMTVAQKAKALENFYYKGLPGFTSVVKFENYGSPYGQVRANMLVKEPNFIWDLREWSITKNVGGSVGFTIQPLRNTAMLDLYRDSATSTGNPTLDALRNEFQTSFVTNFVPQMTTVDAGRSPVVTDDQLIFGLGLSFDNKFAAFDSNSTSTDENPVGVVPDSSTFGQRIAAASAAAKLPWKLSVAQLVARAETQSCAGCHQLAVGADIAPAQSSPNPNALKTIAWPGSEPFTHVSETGALSQLLRERFLPMRAANLVNFTITQSFAAFFKTNLPGWQMATVISALRTKLHAPVNSTTIRSQLKEVSGNIEDLRAADARTTGAFVTVRPAD